MKKYLFISFCMLSHAVFSQSQPPGKLKFGPTIGLNVTNMASNVLDPDNKLGFNIGAKLIYMIGEKASVTGMLLYSEKGSVYRATDPKEKLKESFNYIDFPILYTYMFGGEKLNYYPIIGIQNGLLVKAQGEVEEISGSGTPVKRKEDLVIGLQAYRYEIGVTFGIGGQLQLTSNNTLFLDIRSTQAVSSVLGGHFLPCGGCSSYRNVFLSFNTGILF